jgi:hypothetical protein
MGIFIGLHKVELFVKFPIYIYMCCGVVWCGELCGGVVWCGVLCFVVWCGVL